MIKLKNCPVENFAKEMDHRRVIPFGTGNSFCFLNSDSMACLKGCCPYAIDNRTDQREVELQGSKLPVYQPEKLREEDNCIVLLTSRHYMYDMYLELMDMDLPGNIDCYCFPFMTMMVDEETMDEGLLDQIISKEAPAKIPKIIHSFWFSGDPKPQDYQQCIDTWHRVCPDYKIVEWNQENYDCNKHPFVQKAIELKAWAFASDYARLDVLNEYGGIYLDMDAETVKPFDDLLGNSALLCFDTSTSIDLAVFASAPCNELVQELLKLYENIEIPETRAEYQNYFQPKVVAKTLEKYGIIFNGKMQMIKDIAVLNAADYIKECLESVIHQTLQELEIICVDAGSTDGTREILEEYAQNDPRIKLIHSKVKSYRYQVNFGISMASGKYIGIVELKEFVLFGFGKIGFWILRECCMRKIYPIAITDNNETLWGGNIGGIPLLSPRECMRKFKDVKYLIANSRSKDDIFNQLVSGGIPKSQIHIY